MEPSAFPHHFGRTKAFARGSAAPRSPWTLRFVRSLPGKKSAASVLSQKFVDKVFFVREAFSRPRGRKILAQGISPGDLALGTPPARAGEGGEGGSVTHG